jgi:hypothetical protein
VIEGGFCADGVQPRAQQRAQRERARQIQRSTPEEGALLSQADSPAAILFQIAALEPERREQPRLILRHRYEKAVVALDPTHGRRVSKGRASHSGSRNVSALAL